MPTLPSWRVGAIGQAMRTTDRWPTPLFILLFLAPTEIPDVRLVLVQNFVSVWSTLPGVFVFLIPMKVHIRCSYSTKLTIIWTDTSSPCAQQEQRILRRAKPEKDSTSRGHDRGGIIGWPTCRQRQVESIGGLVQVNARIQPFSSQQASLDPSQLVTKWTRASTRKLKRCSCFTRNIHGIFPVVKLWDLGLAF